jgi:hypothetical protein
MTNSRIMMMAAAGAAGDGGVSGPGQAIFGYGATGGSFSITNRVSDTGVVAADTTGVGTVRRLLGGAAYGS